MAGETDTCLVISDKVTSLLPWQVQPVGTEDCSSDSDRGRRSLVNA